LRRIINILFFAHFLTFPSSHLLHSAYCILPSVFCFPFSVFCLLTSKPLTLNFILVLRSLGEGGLLFLHQLTLRYAPAYAEATQCDKLLISKPSTLNPNCIFHYTLFILSSSPFYLLLSVSCIPYFVFSPYQLTNKLINIILLLSHHFPLFTS